MQVDSFFTKGVSHKVCEDYSIHGTIRGNPFIIVCDGCSGSKDTDFGARLLARSAKKALVDIYHNDTLFDDMSCEELFEHFEKETTHNLRGALTATFSATTVADATLLVAFVYDGEVYWYMRGDGVMVTKRRESALVTMNIEYSTGAPYYLSYDLNKINDLKYKEKYGDGKKTVVTEFNFREMVNGDEEKLKRIGDDVLEYVSSHANECGSFSIDELEYIALLSDGIDALQYKASFDGEKNANDFKLGSVIEDALAFKNYNGEFIQRRFKRFMKDIDRKGYEPYDDISVASIWVADEYATGDIITPRELMK